MDYGQAQPFVAVIDNTGTIYQTDSGRKRTAIGVDLQRENELLEQISDMQEVLDNYYQKLVELGAIVPEKSPEEIARETADRQLELAREQAEQQAEINSKLLNAIGALQSEIADMKQNKSSVNSEIVIEEKPVAKKDKGAK